MNPLLEKTELPQFSKFDPKDVLPALAKILENCRQTRDTLLQQKTYSWNNLVLPLDVAEDELSQMFSPVSHLNSTMNSPELRDVYQQAIEELTEYSTEMGQHQALYEAYKYVAQHDDSLTDSQKKALDDALKGFELSGVALPEAKREAYKKIASKLSKHQSDFENNVLDATMGWSYHTENEDELKGLPENTLNAAQAKAQSQNKSGYVLGIDAPTYLAVMMSAENRDLRKKFYTAYSTRASDQGEQAGKWDNSQNMVDILKLRDEKAKLLGFENYAELSIDTKMAESTQSVLEFMYDLMQKSKAQAKDEVSTLKAFAKSEGLEGSFESWDASFYSEKLQKKRFNFTQEELREYFPIKRVMSGLFEILNRIYGLTVTKETQFDTYHPNVELYTFTDSKGNIRGKIFVDLYARDSKRGGAWMDECRARYRQIDGTVQNPVAYVTCNFMPPLEGKEALLTHTDVVTLFHEFGHALHHILTQVDDLPVSGISGVEWDAVELPSQFMENFCWTEEGISLISQHIKTGESLPKALFEKLNESRQFQSAMQMLRQLEFSIFDFELHMKGALSSADDIQQHLDQTREKVAVTKPPAFNRFQHSFSHIFAGGYAAGYYSYKWAEVLSSDAFAKFEESGNVFSREEGQAFLSCILEKGGSRPAGELFEAYRGRKPTTEALLRHSGIAA